MFFANPILLGGLALISLPIIIYLLHRNQLKETQWAAMQFLIEIIEEQHKRLRLEDWLLLLFRCLMYVFLILALARLVLSSGINLSLVGDGGDSLIVVDNSYSMATKQGPKTRLEMAKDAADGVIGSLPTGYGVSLMAGSDMPETVVGGNLTDHELVKVDPGRQH